MLKAEHTKCVLSLLVVVFLLIMSCGKKDEGKIEFKEDMDKVSYSIGTQIGMSFKQNNIVINTDLLARAIKDIQVGNLPALTESEMMEVMQNFQIQQEEANQMKTAENRVAASAFLAENALKEGVITLEDSLQYKVITEGTGAIPDSTDTVKVHYRGTLIDGTEFDNSYTRGEPAQFSVFGVIRGWTRALQLMKVGSKWNVFIPPELGYGERGSGAIPPNSLLIFEVELIEIVE